jgi:hypothetical protein
MIDYLMKKKFGLLTEVWVEHFAREAELLAPKLLKSVAT